MTTDDIVFTLPDSAIVLYFALKERGPMTAPDMCKLLGKSPASIYRTMRQLRKAGILPPSPWDIIKQEPKARACKAYTLQSDFSHAA